MIKTVIFDCGGVMVGPTTGEWMLPPGYEDFLGRQLDDEGIREFVRYKADATDYVPDAHKMETDREEAEMLVRYYGIILNERMGMGLSDAAIRGLADAQAYHDDRFMLFSDVQSELRRFRARFRVGILSDAPPSFRRILRNTGVLSLMDASVFSFQLGMLKPAPQTYQAILQAMDAKPEECVFLDDSPGNLDGSEASGILGVQMRRVMHVYYPLPALRKGNCVRSLSEFYDFCTR